MPHLIISCLAVVMSMTSCAAQSMRETLPKDMITKKVIYLSDFPEMFPGRAEYSFVRREDVDSMKSKGEQIIAVPANSEVTWLSQKNESTAAGVRVIMFYSVALPSGEMVRFYNTSQIGNRQYETPWN